MGSQDHAHAQLESIGFLCHLLWCESYRGFCQTGANNDGQWYKQQRAVLARSLGADRAARRRDVLWMPNNVFLICAPGNASAGSREVVTRLSYLRAKLERSRTKQPAALPGRSRDTAGPSGSAERARLVSTIAFRTPAHPRNPKFVCWLSHPGAPSRLMFCPGRQRGGCPPDTPGRSVQKPRLRQNL